MKQFSCSSVQSWWLHCNRDGKKRSKKVRGNVEIFRTAELMKTDPPAFMLKRTTREMHN